ncbi:hypothetical protein LN996_06210 [Arthrobacter sp. AK01]|nr:hypothetical protein [Arthrobacter sp. AK01]MCP1414873.1 uncharacterized protein YbjT (DUF2867 family) [Paenarthrobacter sp. A20]
MTASSRHVPAAGSAKRHDGATYFTGDVTTGEGLAAALVGADVVIDCLGAPGSERHCIRTVGGPEVLTMRQMAESWKTVTGRRGKIVELPLAGAMGSFLRAGNNLIPGRKDGAETFVSWLEKHDETL